MKSKEYADCISYCNKVLAVDPSNIKVVYRRANACIARADWEDAQRDLIRTRKLCADALAAAESAAAAGGGGGGDAGTATATGNKSSNQSSLPLTELHATIKSIDAKMPRVKSALAELNKLQAAKYSGAFGGSSSGSSGGSGGVGGSSKASASGKTAKRVVSLYDDKPDISAEALREREMAAASGGSLIESMWSSLVWVFTGGCCRRAKKQA